MMTMKKVGFIGGGNMAEAMIKGMTSQGMRDIIVSEPREDRRKYLEQSYGIKTSESNREIVSSCGIIILAIKPQNMEAVLDEINTAITDDHTVISIAAGVRLPYLSERLKTKKIVRVMPNTPALIQEGITVLSLCECFSDRDISIVREIFMSIGKIITLPEKYMDAVTALSGSGPAFIALFIEALVEGGMKMGLTSDDARALAVQTAIGTLKLLDTGMSPSALRNMVTSPGGTTEAGLKVYDDEKLKDIVIKGIEAATKRAQELGNASRHMS